MDALGGWAAPGSVAVSRPEEIDSLHLSLFDSGISGGKEEETCCSECNGMEK